VIPYVTASEKIGGVVAEQAKLFKQAVDKELELIKKAAGQKKPSSDELSNLVAPVSGLMTQVAELESKYRGKDLVNNLKAVAEGTPVLGWVCMEPTPGPYVKELIGASEFWSNKILREFKGKDENQVNWVTHYSGFLKGLVPYIMKNHATGLSWNTGGGRPLAAGPVAAAGVGGAEREFKEILEEHVNLYVTESDKIGGVVAEQAKLFKQACFLELEIISKASGNKKPSPEEFQQMIQPVSEVMSKIAEVESKYRGKDHVNHLKTVAEGTPALGWVCMEPTPGPYVKETIAASEFWSNKILKDFKGKDEGQVNWVKGYNGFLKALVSYILAHHTTGLSWNTTGGRTQAPVPVAASGSGGAHQAFVDIIVEFVDPYVSISGEIGGEVATQAKLFKEAVQKSAELIGKASTQKKPTPEAFQTLLAPVSELMTKIAEVESKYRGKDLVNHLKAVAEGTPALGWLCIEPAPGPYTKEMIGASEFWSNKILREHKGKDEKHVNWVNAFNGFLKALVPYIMSYHTTGLTWK